MYKFLLSMACALTLSAEMIGGVAVVVKDRAITLYDIKQEMQNSSVDIKKATDTLIRQKLEEAEVKERRITVSNGEVYDDIKKSAKRNNMSVNDFYEAALDAKGLESSEVKKRIKQKLLSQKLYYEISYSQVSEPTEKEIEEYFNLHKSDYKHPSAFTVIIYQAKSKQVLNEKVQNPMFYAPQVKTNEQMLPYDRISPELANLLSSIPVNSFTPIIPDGKGGYMSFYVKEIHTIKEDGLENVKDQISNSIMAQRREYILGDYFARLRLNADIKIIRMPE